ncbi:hypothetical protein GOP47_0015458 [Adiantum capillus-veneris]|uniref:FHA domain-containing protein n=1 Tax=Adiantum capillus-veneris TaxID=13818 RepID=A0A9D4ZCN4_ADICA|nr:hypothetical protein GOP47_0015458 [Adiantum capillus-veneris]
MAGEAGEATTTAAKVAAEAAADVVTGGVVAEAGPPPDFSLWTVEDDILLKNAVEAGAAIEALAKGAVQFSQRFTVRELRERWRALLYDPVISEEAALRMLKSEALVANSGKLSSLSKLKYPQVSNRKRKLKSVRFHHYNKKRLGSEKPSSSPLERDNEEMHVKEEVESCSESSFSQMARPFPANGVRELAEAIPPKEEAYQQNPIFSCGLQPEETAGPLHSIPTGEEGVKQTLPQQVARTTEDLSGASINEAKERPSPMEQVAGVHESCDVAGLDGSRVQSSQPMLDKANAEMMEASANNTATKAFDKPLSVEIPIPEQMICVLNTEDTEIPSPPSGSVTHLPSLFSSRYFPLELKSMKCEPSLLGGGYARTDDFELSSHGLMRSVSEDKRTVGSLMKQEPMLEGLECEPKYRMKMHTSLSAAHINSADLSAHTRDNEAIDLPENAGSHMLSSMLLASQEKADDLSLLDPDAPGYLKELVLPMQAGILSHLDQDLCHTDQMADAEAVRRGTITGQEHDDGLESDQELPSFSDVEAMILDMDLDSAFDEDALARAESRRLYRRQRKTLIRLEQGARASLERTLTHHGAIAVLYGRHLRYYIKRNEVLLGRVTLDNTVDIDLGKEGRANKVSRRQATIRLMEDGLFYLKNLGRRDLSVNNIPIPNGQHAMLGSGCLIEVGGMRFIFETNRRLVKERVEEMLQNRQHAEGIRRDAAE